jgi:hypothetical protein
MMKNEEIVNGLSGLGFMSGYAITDGTITLWENAEPQPSDSEIANGAILWKEKELQLLQEKAAAKEAAQAKLAALGLTADDLKALGL